MITLSSKQRYPTDLTEAQWAALQQLLARGGGPGRPRSVDLRQVVNAILYLKHTGCQWRMLPRDFPRWSVVRYYFDKWNTDGTWEQINSIRRTE
jgi:putative transposase